jgi:ABC-type antimicrobial peptide transport system permease subunit
VFGVEALDDTRRRGTAEQRFTLTLVALFAVMALGLSALGVHGVLSYMVTQRTREIGIRMALGARPDRLRKLVVGQGLALSGLGIGLGLSGALALSRLFASLLYDVPPRDPATFAGVALLLVAVAGLACYLPARAATRVDPARTLRAD